MKGKYVVAEIPHGSAQGETCNTSWRDVDTLVAVAHNLLLKIE